MRTIITNDYAKLVSEILSMCEDILRDEQAMCGEHLLADDIVNLINQYKECNNAII